MPARHHGHASNCSRLSVTFILNFHRRGYYPISLFIRNICLHIAKDTILDPNPQYQFNNVCGIACILNAANRRGNQFVILHIIAVGSWLPFYKLIQRRRKLFCISLNTYKAELGLTLKTIPLILQLHVIPSFIIILVFAVMRCI